MFGSNLAKEARNNTAPGMWWEQYGDSAPVRFSRFTSEKRNRLDKEMLNDVLYVHYNLKLKSRTKTSEMDPILLDEIDMTSEWVEETENPAQWLDRFSSLDGGDLNTRQFSSAIFGPNDHLFNL
ncbi:hypothetical protein HPP92_002832 [Vanilla planifolia]|uniref:Uncharacterized protein n=1 Tax=Vanilla planifolia TaxID=51239 RepID=A0A835RTQ4_VANPL|nr:hypothetical protein HPP92_002832 [Vanilla planifolia]